MGSGGESEITHIWGSQKTIVNVKASHALTTIRFQVWMSLEGSPFSRLSNGVCALMFASMNQNVAHVVQGCWVGVPSDATMSLDSTFSGILDILGTQVASQRLQRVAIVDYSTPASRSRELVIVFEGEAIFFSSSMTDGPVRDFSQPFFEVYIRFKRVARSRYSFGGSMQTSS